MRVQSRRIAALGVGAVLISAAFAGCGGSDDSGSDALSKEDYIAQSDAICADFNEVADASRGDFVDAAQSGDFEAAAGFIEGTDDESAASIEERKALTPPEEDQATMDEMFELIDQQEELVPDLTAAIRANDQQAIQDVSDQGEGIDDQINAIADDYGFVDCGSAGDSDS